MDHIDSQEIYRVFIFKPEIQTQNISIHTRAMFQINKESLNQITPI